MSYLSDYCNVIRRWLDDEDAYDDATVTEWIRDAEVRLNNELRVPEMVAREYATFDDDCAILPSDWLELIYVRLKGGAPFDYITPHDYWEKRYEPLAPFIVNDPSEVYPTFSKKMLYTVIGQTLYVYPPINPEALTKVEVAYYRKIFPLGDDKDPVFDRYPALYRNATLTAAAPYIVEDERINTWGALATAGIQKANDAARAGRWSGSPLPKLIRGFG